MTNPHKTTFWPDPEPTLFSGTSQYSLSASLEARTYPVEPLSGEMSGDEPEIRLHLFNT